MTIADLYVNLNRKPENGTRKEPDLGLRRGVSSTLGRLLRLVTCYDAAHGEVSQS